MQLVRKAAEQYQRLIMDCTRPTLAIHQQQVKSEKKTQNSIPLEKKKISIATDKSRLNFSKCKEMKMCTSKYNLRARKDRGQVSVGCP
jgi:hypothetical protein